jgi:hypothetical protein
MIPEYETRTDSLSVPRRCTTKIFYEYELQHRRTLIEVTASVGAESAMKRAYVEGDDHGTLRAVGQVLADHAKKALRARLSQ